MRILTVATGLTLALSSTSWAQSNNGKGNDPYASKGAGPLSGQSTSNVHGNQTQIPIIPSVVPPGMETSPKMEQDQAKFRNIDRQKQLVLDTQKLLALAAELKEEVDKSNKDTLSLDVVRKAEEIEKLAHSVKEKMKGI
ncbi:MAG: hypothetical protein M3O31_18230 [Acidobacteriota bacterium]|nr:hypothetical protein [Acidobacteriota bacterium]